MDCFFKLDTQQINLPGFSLMQPSKMTNDNKREFLRKMPEMVEEWESISKMVETWDEGGGKLSLSDSTADALIITFRCTANRIV